MPKKRPAESPSVDASELSVVMARFGAAHGVRGEVRLKSHTEEPMAVLGYSPLIGSNGREYRLTTARPAAGASSDMLVVRVEGIGDRTDAEAVNGIDLSAPRSRLPATDPDDFYHADLIGLTAETANGELLGEVVSIHDHGAGDLLELSDGDAPSVLVPFTRKMVPTVDVEGGRIIVDPPAGLFDAPAPPEDEGS